MGRGTVGPPEPRRLGHGVVDRPVTHRRPSSTPTCTPAPATPRPTTPGHLRSSSTGTARVKYFDLCPKGLRFYGVFGYITLRMSRSDIARAEPNTGQVSTAALSRLLLDLFSLKEFELFLKNYYEEVLCELSPDAPAFYFSNAASSMQRRGLVDDQLRSNLLVARPRRPDMIAAVFKDIAPPSKSVTLKFEGRIEDLTTEKLSSMIDFLRTTFGDESTVIVAIRSGSIEIDIATKPGTQAIAVVKSSGTQGLALRQPDRALERLERAWKDRPNELRRSLLECSGLRLIDVPGPGASQRLNEDFAASERHKDLNDMLQKAKETADAETRADVVRQSAAERQADLMERTEAERLADGARQKDAARLEDLTRAKTRQTVLRQEKEEKQVIYSRLKILFFSLILAGVALAVFLIVLNR